MKPLWFASSLFLLVGCSWFAVMEFVLHHPGFVLRAVVAALIVLYAALSLAYTRIPSEPLRTILSLASIGTFALGLYALLTGLHTKHLEGYIFLLAVGLLAQSLLALRVLARPRLHPA